MMLWRTYFSSKNKQTKNPSGEKVEEKGKINHVDLISARKWNVQPSQLAVSFNRPHNPTLSTTCALYGGENILRKFR